MKGGVERPFHRLWVFARLMCNRRLSSLAQARFAALAGHLVFSAFQTQQTQGRSPNTVGGPEG